jgi:hypothetical protein
VGSALRADYRKLAAGAGAGVVFITTEDGEELLRGLPKGIFQVIRERGLLITTDN